MELVSPKARIFVLAFFKNMVSLLCFVNSLNSSGPKILTDAPLSTIIFIGTPLTQTVEYGCLPCCVCRSVKVSSELLSGSLLECLDDLGDEGFRSRTLCTRLEELLEWLVLLQTRAKMALFMTLVTFFIYSWTFLAFFVWKVHSISET